MSEFRTEAGTAVLVCSRASLTTRYVLHIDLGGRAVMIELLDRPDGLACGDCVQVMFADGRTLDCQLLDDTQMCTIVGDGFRESA
jgi:hypothetical protein